MPIYLDNAATTQPDPAVVEAVRECLSSAWGNPSSAHSRGADARRALDQARVQVAKLAGCELDEVHFTSGGTEADNWALLGTLDVWRERRNHLVTVATEHHAVVDVAKWWQERGGAVTILAPDHEGMVTAEQVAGAITARTAMVSVMQVNNELGTLLPVADIGAACRERDVTFHTDAVQSYGKIPLSFRALNADLMSISSHKIYGPKGVGALLVKRGTRISPRQIGGGQERAWRPGTENLPGIVGFGRAAELSGAALEQEMREIAVLRDRLEALILEQIPEVRINGSRTSRAPGIVNISFLGCEGEALLIALDRKGFCVSTGSACSAGALGASHVLLGIGLDVRVAQASLRFSFGRFNRLSDVDALMAVLPDVVDRQRQTAPAGLR
ncbi:cysteine desulfurase [candidate division KSB1 bacterium]|nr:cysteine desulfurase [candidate division KSB1 bacterium]